MVCTKRQAPPTANSEAVGHKNCCNVRACSPCAWCIALHMKGMAIVLNWLDGGSSQRVEMSRDEGTHQPWSRVRQEVQVLERCPRPAPEIPPMTPACCWAPGAAEHPCWPEAAAGPLRLGQPSEPRPSNPAGRFSSRSILPVRAKVKPSTRMALLQKSRPSKLSKVRESAARPYTKTLGVSGPNMPCRWRQRAET